MAKTIKASEVRANWASILKQVYTGDTEVVIEKSGIPVAAVISARDYKEFKKIRQQRPERFPLFGRMRDALKKTE